MTPEDRLQALYDALQTRLLIINGAMGDLLQQRLTAARQTVIPEECDSTSIRQKAES